MEGSESDKLQSKIAKRIEYIQQIFNQHESLLNLNNDFLTIKTCFEGAVNNLKESSTHNSMVYKELLSAQFKMLIKIQKKLENEISVEMNDYDAAIQKYKRKNKDIIEVIEEFKPTPQKAEDFDPNALNFSWFALKKSEIETISANFLISIAPEGVDPSKIVNFVKAIRESMNTCFYHNFTHVNTVMHFIYYMWTQSPKLKELLTKDDLYLACIAGISHDLGHGGKNNGFQIAEKNNLSFMSHETAVLEHYHAAKMLEILSKEECNVLHCFDEAKIKLSKELMVEAIMSTDMTRHNKLIKELKSKEEFDMSSVADKKFLLGTLLHTSDLNNVAIRTDLYLTWAAVLGEEFHSQFLAEKEKGYKLTTFLEYKNRKVFLGGQLFFSAKIARPLFEAVDEKFGLEFCKTMDINIGELQKMIEAST